MILDVSLNFLHHGFHVVHSFLRGAEFIAKPISFGASLPHGTFQTTHIATERINFMQSVFGFIGGSFDVLDSPIKKDAHNG